MLGVCSPQGILYSALTLVRAPWLGGGGRGWVARLRLLLGGGTLCRLLGPFGGIGGGCPLEVEGGQPPEDRGNVVFCVPRRGIWCCWYKFMMQCYSNVVESGWTTAIGFVGSVDEDKLRKIFDSSKQFCQF